MLQLLTSISVIVIAINQLMLAKRLQQTRNALSDVMGLLVTKWTAEQVVMQQHVDAIIDDTIDKIRRDSDDVD